jgi:hypothetical protein
LQTSTHVAPVSWANRVSGIRIAAWVEPPSGHDLLETL